MKNQARFHLGLSQESTLRTYPHSSFSQNTFLVCTGNPPNASHALFPYEVKESVC